MKFLSTRRRHPLAGLVVVLLGLVVAGALFSAFAPASADDSGKSDEELIAQGRQLFVVGCSSCHGLNAEGIVTDNGTNLGPPLIGVGAAAVDFWVGTGRMPLAAPGVQAPASAEVLYNEEETAAMAAYIASLQPGPAIPSDDEIDVSDLSNDEIVEGGTFFKTNCTACHNFAAVGGALPSGGYAPSLLDTTPRHIIEAMLTGPGQMPVFSDGVLTPQEKKEILGYLQQLKDEPSYGGSGLGSKGPVTEGLWGWLAGIGVLVLATVWIANNGARA